MRILLADGQPQVRFGLRVLLERQLGFEVVGEAVNVADMLAQMETNCPDLVLLDWELPGLAAVDSLSTLRQVCPSLLVTVLSGRMGTRRAALAAGADAFVSKSDPPERLLAAINDCRRRYRRRSGSSSIERDRTRSIDAEDRERYSEDTPVMGTKSLRKD